MSSYAEESEDIVLALFSLYFLYMQKTFFNFVSSLFHTVCMSCHAKESEDTVLTLFSLYFYTCKELSILCPHFPITVCMSSYLEESEDTFLTL